MKNWLTYYRIPLLSTAVCLALSLLILFQINWLLTAKAMIEEQFDQKVNLALGNTMTQYNKKYGNELSLDSFDSCSAVKPRACCSFGADNISLPKNEQVELEKMLVGSMSCYGIDEGYDMAIVNNCTPIESTEKSYCCSIDPLDVSEENLQLYVSFPGKKEQYVFDNIKVMLISSILISLLLALVSFIILKALIQQKMITDNNIDFFNNAAHELKTPLTNISLAVNLFNRKNEQHKDKKYLEIIQKESAKLTNQIERVLYLSKMETGEYQLKEEELDLKTIISDAVQYMDMIREEKNGKIQLDFPESSCLIKGDKFHLSNICINMIDNALKYCETEPQLTISLQIQKDMYQLLFSDNGIGISKCDQEHIFKKFQRVNTGDVQNTKGFGIGLSYVKKALEIHKGFIKVNSEVNKGSQFEISIPRS